MATTILKTNLELTHHEVNLVDGSSLELIVQPPTYAQVLQERSLVLDGIADQILFRLKTSLVGWLGVTDESGDEVKFTPERFGEMCRQKPDLFLKASDVVTPYFYGVPDRKN